MFQGHSPYLKHKLTVSQVMMTVCLALIPGVLAQLYFFGFGVLIQLSITIATAYACEAAILRIRNYPIKAVLKDNSALLTACLLGISIPAIAPWWIAVLGTLFAIVVVKQLYGGLGYNLFNPAMAGYVFLLISFPLPMTQWPASSANFDLLNSIQLIFQFNSEGLDAITAATALDLAKVKLAAGLMHEEIMHLPEFGIVAGLGWEWVNVAYLVGGCYLIKARIISWHIPIAMLVSLFLCASIFFLVGSQAAASPLIHLFSGATMLGAFFIATDPVSACTTPKGRIYYGLLIGVLIYMIRTFGGYPDAIAFSVLLANMAVPLIDHYSQPRVYGYEN